LGIALFQSATIYIVNTLLKEHIKPFIKLTIFLNIIIYSIGILLLFLSFIDSRKQVDGKLERGTFTFFAYIKGFKFNPKSIRHYLGTILLVLTFIYGIFILGFLYYSMGSNGSAGECLCFPGVVLGVSGAFLLFGNYFNKRKPNLFYVECLNCEESNPIILDETVITIRCRRCKKTDRFDPFLNDLDGREKVICVICRNKVLKKERKRCPACGTLFNERNCFHP
jgi:hypothetical protein